MRSSELKRAEQTAEQFKSCQNKMTKSAGSRETVREKRLWKLKKEKAVRIQRRERMGSGCWENSGGGAVKPVGPRISDSVPSTISA